MSSFSGSVMSAVTAESSLCSPSAMTNLFTADSPPPPLLSSSDRMQTASSDLQLTYEDDEESEFGSCQNESSLASMSGLTCTSHGDERLVVYVKGTSETKAFKDCSYCHLVLLALEEKQIPYTLEVLDLRQKPDWLLDACPSGFLPLIRYGDFYVHESSKILDFLQEKYPQPELTVDEDGMSAGGGIFASFRRYLLNKDKGKDAYLQDRLETQLQQMNEYLVNRIDSDGPFFGGEHYNLTDIQLLPRLFRMQVALNHFKQWTLPNSFLKVKEYLEAAYRRPSWKKSACEEKEVIHYWQNHLSL